MSKFDQKLDFPDMPSEANALDDINDALANASDSSFHKQQTPSKPTLEDTKRLLMDIDADFDNEFDDELEEEIESLSDEAYEDAPEPTDSEAMDDEASQVSHHFTSSEAVHNLLPQQDGEHNQSTSIDQALADSEVSPATKTPTAAPTKAKCSKTAKIYSRDALAGLEPTTEFNTAIASSERYVPMLPTVKPAHAKRQLILDTETTGLEALNGDRIIEIGIVEVVNRRFSGEKLHVYINPERDMDAEAVAVHGISLDFLADKPVFSDIGEQVLEFLEGAEIIAHNAPFDIGFLDMEFKKLGVNDFESRISVTDSLAVAKSHYPGQKNSLDALVKRLEIITKDRTFHGALLDAEILADVYLTMTGGQVSLSLGETSASRGEHKHFANLAKLFCVQQANADDQKAHEAWLLEMDGEDKQFSARW